MDNNDQWQNFQNRFMDDMELGGLEQVPALSGRVLRYAMIMIIKYGNDGEEKVKGNIQKWR